MGRGVHSLPTYFLLLLSVILTALVLIPGVKTRPLDNSGSEFHESSTVSETGNFLDGFSIGAMKKSGPSPGIGHRSFKQVQTNPGIGSVKDSGPSPGAGHGYGDDNHT